MYGFIQTPPRPAVRLPSLEPWNPLSGTVGVSPGRRRRSRPTLTFAPTSMTSDDPAGLPPLERLECLIDQIRHVLKAYSALPTRSLVYLANIRDFLRRAIELNPNAIEEEEDQPVSPSLLPCYRDGRNRTPPGRRGRRSMLPRRGSSFKMPEMEDVEKLEKEWWASDVVAAWYGPRPGSRMLTERTKSKRAEEGREGCLKRDLSFVGLNDDGLME